MYCNYLFCYTTSHGNHKEELEIATSLRPVHLLDIGALFWTSFNDFRNGTFKQQRLRSRSRSSIQRLVKKMGITSVRTRLQWDGWLHLASKHNLFVRLTVTAFLDPQIFILPSAKNDETCLTSYSSLYLQAFSFTTALSSCEKCHAWQRALAILVNQAPARVAVFNAAIGSSWDVLRGACAGCVMERFCYGLHESSKIEALWICD